MKLITNPEEIVTIVKSYKKNSFKIVLAHGTFDLLHVGHIKHFQEAKSLGDILVVTITIGNKSIVY